MTKNGITRIVKKSSNIENKSDSTFETKMLNEQYYPMEYH